MPVKQISLSCLHLNSSQQQQNCCIFAMEGDSRISWGEPPGQAAKFRGKVIDRHVYACDVKNYTRRHKTSIQHCHSNHNVAKVYDFLQNQNKHKYRIAFPEKQKSMTTARTSETPWLVNRGEFTSHWILFMCMHTKKKLVIIPGLIHPPQMQNYHYLL